MLNYTQALGLGQPSNPNQALLEGLQVAAAIRQRQEQQAAAQQAAEQQAAFERDRDAAMRAGTASALGDFVLKYPKMREAAKQKWDMQTAEQKEAEFVTGAQVFSAIDAGAIDVAKQLMEDRVKVEESNGRDPSRFKSIVSLLEKDPKQVAGRLGMILAASDPERWKQFASAKGEKGEGYEILKPDAVGEMGLPKGPTYQRNTKTGKVEILGGGGERYEILQPKDAQALGLPADAPYQRDQSSGRITAIGNGGITIKMPPQIGQIPPDYRMRYDTEGRPEAMEVIPGSKTERELKVGEQKAVSAAESAGQQADIVIEDIRRLRQSIKGQKVADPVTGITGAIASKVPGSARRSAEELATTIKANIGFDKLNQMRQESPTGGALGQVTEQELKFLQSVLGSIDLGQKDEDILRNVDRLEKTYARIMEKAAAYPNASKYGFGKSLPSDSVSVKGKTYTRPASFTDEQWAAYKQAMGIK